MTDAALDDLHATTPGSATRLAPRAWLHTDAPCLSLAGEWDFRWSPVADAPAFEDPDGWGTLPVPSHWVLHGHGAPSYTNVQYPFPIDAPHPPDENPTGDHRRTFTVPGSFDGAARVLLRFDGVESHFRVWLNGQEVGWSTGSRLATEFDVTELLVPGDNELRVRVHQWSAASYLEDQDQWWLPGIFRDVTLLARPVAPIDDVFVRAAWSAVPGDGASAGTAASGRPATGTGTITVPSIEATFPVRFRVPELGVDVTWASAEDVAPVTVEGVEPWSAEVPRLYDATMSAAGETVALRLGFRTVQIVGDRFLVNGERVVFHGVNRHETHPERGRVFDEAHARADMALMKRSNVNAIRTSHYPPHPRVLDLADELGFWVVLECDLETHGFEALGWQGNPSDDPAWEDAYLDRIARTVERDKNHASIVMWSLGNESGTGRNLAAMAQWVHARDTERPVHYEGDYTGEYTDVYSRMYPTLQETESIGGGAATPLLGCGPAEAARQRSKPFLHCEYVHAMGNGPGQIAEYEALVDRYPRLHGGFVWEWRDHGLLAHTADGTPYYAYGGDHHEVVHDGNFVMDGLVLPDDTPTPGLAEFAAVVAPVRLSVSPFGGGTAAGGGTVLIENRYHSASTAGLRFVWTLSRNGVVEASGRLAPGVVAARGSATVPVPAEVLAAAALAPGDELWFEVVAELAGPTAWADTGHVVARTQTLVASAPARVVDAAPQRAGTGSRGPRSGWDGDRLGEATFTARGDLASLKGHAVAGPRLELWRAPTDNDRGASQGGYETADPVLTGGVGDPDAPSSASRWEARGLDRLTHRLVAVERTDDGLVQRVRVAAANSGAGVEVTHRWTLTDAGLLLRTDAVPFGGWDVTWPRVGVRIDLPAALLDGTVSWFGTGPDESYADSSHAARVGRFEAPVSAMTTRYSMPQETGHRPELRTLTVGPFTVSTVPDPASGHRAGFTLTPWTAQQVGRAGHPHELPTPDALYLYLDDAQHGLGSRACGLDVLPEHQLWPSARSWSVLLA
ncbi:beta-galactosidase [Curtobacterium sp. MCJR17_055]|uniref:glycoside hydrolase family 2 TIM barrel-domain containing protein n=1 Tax=unclassified Curtobacterium TaxID=257496 RepID=UPI000D881363|nr:MULTISPECIES: glycoside hydrolase family 2 TIM barrel-domain containing protein [unclassified Curtobacterium]PYY33809.1 beta-galactosidase [Curtobacterium sp. MCBD17_029]PYY58721.1 beta-galactosidase [Curtobacterium sp. MCJR17_055]PYY59738.1 beta-galactosidase [Curtobacterium sp. MCPF17_015]